jgi:hypothetical protein
VRLDRPGRTGRQCFSGEPEEAEQQVEAILAEMHSPEVVSYGPRLQACYARLQPAEESVQAFYARWAELEAKQQ